MRSRTSDISPEVVNMSTKRKKTIRLTSSIAERFCSFKMNALKIPNSGRDGGDTNNERSYV
jgi:hypothetical protein